LTTPPTSAKRTPVLLRAEQRRTLHCACGCNVRVLEKLPRVNRAELAKRWRIESPDTSTIRANRRLLRVIRNSDEIVLAAGEVCLSPI